MADEKKLENLVSCSQNNKRRILVVDDEPSLLRVQQRLLQMNPHYAVDTVTGLDEAFSAHAMTNYDLTVSDIDLKDGNGLDLPKRLNTPQMNILFVSGGSWEKAKDAGYPCLKKPFSNLEYLERVKQMLY